jgi:hypothetical protein
MYESVCSTLVSAPQLQIATDSQLCLIRQVDLPPASYLACKDPPMPEPAAYAAIFGALVFVVVIVRKFAKPKA